jgi:hypothetical protein
MLPLWDRFTPKLRRGQAEALENAPPLPLKWPGGTPLAGSFRGLKPRI